MQSLSKILYTIIPHVNIFLHLPTFGLVNFVLFLTLSSFFSPFQRNVHVKKTFVFPNVWTETHLAMLLNFVEPKLSVSAPGSGFVKFLLLLQLQLQLVHDRQWNIFLSAKTIDKPAHLIYLAYCFIFCAPDNYIKVWNSSAWPGAGAETSLRIDSAPVKGFRS